MTTFIDFSTGARLSGFSMRQFRRLIAAAGVPVIHIKGKFFMLNRDFEKWMDERKGIGKG